MTNLVVTLHIIALCIALGGRIIFMPMLKKLINDGLNERLDSLQELLAIPRLSDMGLILAIATGMTLFLFSGVSLTDTHWSFKLKLVTLLLLITDIGAFHLAQMRVVNHYDRQMIPALKRLNTLAVILMSCMVLFSTFSM